MKVVPNVLAPTTRALILAPCVLLGADCLAASGGAADVDRAPLAASPAVPMADPETLLERMNRAQRNLSYEGTLVYLHGHRLATLHIAHQIIDGAVRERLLALSGPVRAVARNERGVTCMLPDSHPIALPGLPTGGRSASAVLRTGPVNFDRIRGNYLLHGLGMSRVAGRDTDVVGIVPRDNYRYGYRFYIDRDSGLALKIDLMDEASEPVEQVMFTNVAIDQSFNEGVAAPLSDHGESNNTSHLGEQEPDSERRGVGWSVNDLPPGFEVMASEGNVVTTGTPTVARAQIVIGDGLASASIYIEPAGGRVLNGATRMGAITAVGATLDGHQVTVVGEIPERTARRLMAGLRPVSD